MRSATRFSLLAGLLFLAVVGAVVTVFLVMSTPTFDKNDSQGQEMRGAEAGQQDLQKLAAIGGQRDPAIADFKKLQVIAEREARVRQMMENPVEARLAATKAEQAALKAFLDRHNADAVDPKWGPTTSSALSKGIDMLKEKGLSASFGDPDCRNDSCVVNVQWSDPRKVDAEIGEVVTHSFAVNCNRSVVLPGERETGPVKAVLTMDCESWKSSGSVPFVPPVPGGPPK